MKKRTVVLLIALTCVIITAILVIDYYRSIYVSSSGKEKEQSTVLEDASDVFLQEETKVEKTDNQNFASFCFFGDNLIHENVLNFANRKAGGNGARADYSKGFDFKPLYKNVEPLIRDADFSVCNQASLVGANDAVDALSGYPLFNSPSVLGNDLASIGIDGVNIGNNHLLDMGYSGLKNSIEFWKSQNVALFGGYLSEEEKFNTENKLLKINGICFSVLSFTAGTNGLYDENGECIPYFTLRGTEIMKVMLEDEIKKCSEISEAVIVMINWENSAGFEVTEFQKRTAKILCDAGADIIIGSGPKTIQPVEWLTREDGSKTLCAYSLGNFIGTMQYTENLVGGAISFDVKKISDQVEIENVVFHPTVIHYNEDFTEISVVPLEDYTSEQFLVHGSNIRYGNTDFSVLYDIVKKCIPTSFLTSDIR